MKTRASPPPVSSRRPRRESGWVDHVNEVANATLLPRAGSWYMGANVPGKPRVFMPYGAGVGVYREICEGVVRDGWRGFSFSGGD